MHQLREGTARMSDVVERTVADLTIRLDRSLCVGFAQCIDESAVAFRLDDDDLAAFESPEQETRERLLEACRVCPVEALVVHDADGNQLIP
jgi:ferredoxin